jgi:hypothetical protein
VSKTGDYVDKYLAIRQKKREMEARHKEELAPINKALSALEDYFQSAMDQNGLEQLKSGSGTAYKSVQTSVKASDKIAFLEWVKQHEAWHLLDIRPAKTAVEEFIDEEGTPPPGVDMTRHLKVNVRKG